MLPSKNEMLSMYNKVSSRVKQYALNLTPLELKVDEATNHEPWGPHGTVMAEIARAAFDYENYKQIMGVIARRLQSEGENWRHVYKSLLLLEYLSKHGPQKVVDELSSNLGVVERLQRFEYLDKNGKDWGLNVRQRAKELSSLISDPDRIKRERQKAKENESKYTGVSAEDSRMGFGLGSTSTSFGSASSSFGGGSGFGGGGSALSGMGGSRMKGFGSEARGFGSVARYDDDLDAGHTAVSTDDLDSEDLDAKEATKKRIESLKKKQQQQADSPDGRGSPPLKGSRVQQVAAESDSKGPKRLSQVKVNPSIAISLGVPSKGGTPSTAQQQAAPASTGGDVLDLFGIDDSAAPAPSAAAAADSSWDAFAAAGPPPPQNPAKQDGWADLLEGSGSDSVAQPAAASDPFAALGAPSAAAAASSGLESFSADPFASFSGPQKKAAGSLPIAPTPPKADADPFAALTTAGAPSLKPHSPLKAAGSAISQPSADPFATDLFGAPQLAAPRNNPAASGGASRGGFALPEDMFSAVRPPQPGFAGVRVNVGTNPQLGGGSPSFSAGLGGSPGRFPGPQSAASDPFGQPASSSFGNFSSAPQSNLSTEDWFGSMSVGAPKPSGPTAEALGGGQKMAPNAPQPNLPPPVVKQDPFAGLAGF